MDTQQSNLIRLYEEEVAAYKRQVDDLKRQNKHADDKNTVLIGKIRRLEDLVEKAHVANKDLHTAFEHVQSENLRLQRFQGTSQEVQRADEGRAEQLMDQCLVMANENISWTTTKERMNQRIKYLERECERYNRDNNMLGKQVRHLLKTLEEERGMIIRREAEVSADERVLRAPDVIDKHLVTFESIEELQRQNQNLLSLVKKLSVEDEERQTHLESEDVKRLTSEVEALKGQLEEIKNDRERIVNAFNTILKERDLFKILLCKTRQVEHMTPEIFQRMVSVACASGPAITDTPADTQDKDAHIVDLKAMISKLEQEIKDLKDELENVRTDKDKEIKLKTELLEKAKLKIMDEAKRAEAISERNEVLTTNMDCLTKEFDETRTKFQKVSFELDQMNQTKKDLESALEQEKRLRQSDIASIISEIQTKFDYKNQFEAQNRDLNGKVLYLEQLMREKDAAIRDRDTTICQIDSAIKDKDAAISQLEAAIREKEAAIREIQRLRDSERANRIELSRNLYKSYQLIQELERRRNRKKGNSSSQEMPERQHNKIPSFLDKRLPSSPEKRMASQSPEKRMTPSSPEKKLTPTSPEKRVIPMSPEKRPSSLSPQKLPFIPDKTIASISPQRFTTQPERLLPSSSPQKISPPSPEKKMETSSEIINQHENFMELQPVATASPVEDMVPEQIPEQNEPSDKSEILDKQETVDKQDTTDKQDTMDTQENLDTQDQPKGIILKRRKLTTNI